MAIKIECSACGVKLKVADQFAGRAAPCPKCSHPVQVPTPVSPPYPETLFTQANAPLQNPAQRTWIWIGMAGAWLLAGVVVYLAFADTTKPAPVSVSRPSNRTSVPEIKPEPDAVARGSFSKFAKEVVATAQALVEGKKFKIQTGGLGIVDARYEISGDYTFDVKKSTSIIYPYVGEIRLERALIYDKLLSIENFVEAREKIVIECGFQNEEWKTKTNLTEAVLKR